MQRSKLAPFLKLSQGCWSGSETGRETLPKIRYGFNQEDAPANLSRPSVASDNIIKISKSIDNDPSPLASLGHKALKSRCDSYFPSPTKPCEEIRISHFDDAQRDMSKNLDVIPEVDSESRCENCRKRKLQVFKNILFLS